MPRKKTDLSQRLEAVIKTLVPQQEQNPDDLGPMMRAIKAVHSISDHTSTTPEDLEHQRAAQELFGRLVTPSIGIRNDSLTVGSIPAEWVSLEHGHDRHHAVCTATAAATPAASWAMPAFWPASWHLPPGLTCSRLSIALRPSIRSPPLLRTPLPCGIT